MEIWKSIEGFEGRYEVSSYGRVRSVDHYFQKRHRNGKMCVPYLSKGKILKTGFRGGRKEKYPWATFIKDKYRSSQSIHRLVATAFIPNPENKPEVNHKDGDKLNNHYDNLEWCTRKENVQHSVKNGLLHTNGAHFNAILTIKQVIQIKKQLLKGISQHTIAKKYNIKQSAVSAIKVKKSWKHVTI